MWRACFSFRAPCQSPMTITSDPRLDAPPIATAGGFDFVYSPRIRSIVSQAVVLALLLWGLYEMVVNTQANLAKLNQNFGFDFLGKASGFDLSTSLIPYSSNSSYATALIAGFWNTVLVSVLGMIISTVVGVAIGIMRLSKNQVVSGFATLFIEIIRNVPLLLQLFVLYALVLKPLPGVKQAINLFDSVFISNRGIMLPHPAFAAGTWLALLFLAVAVVGAWFYARWARQHQFKTGKQSPVWTVNIIALVLAPIVGFAFAGWPVTWDYPALAGFNFKGGMTIVPELAALLIGLSIFYAASTAEIVRSGIMAVSHGQTEASMALGLTRGQALRQVILPQALRVMIPPMASQLLSLTKDSSLAIAIGFPDLMYAAGTVNNQSGKAIEVFMLALIVYLGLSLLTAAFMNWFNSRMKLVER
jgi:general L-amino acid transport system permease protein